jgi:hypothetical protein
MSDIDSPPGSQAAEFNRLSTELHEARDAGDKTTAERLFAERARLLPSAPGCRSP